MGLTLKEEGMSKNQTIQTIPQLLWRCVAKPWMSEQNSREGKSRGFTPNFGLSELTPVASLPSPAQPCALEPFPAPVLSFPSPF